MNKGKVKLSGKPCEVFREIEILEEIGLAVPQVTYLMRALSERGFVVNKDIFTVEKAKEELLRLLKD